MIELINKILFVIVKMFERVYDNSWKMDYNVYDSYEFIFVKKGNIDFWVESEKIELKVGDFLIIKFFIKYKFEVVSLSKVEFVVMGFYLKLESKVKVDELKEIYGFLKVLEEIINRFYFFYVRKRSSIFFCLEFIFYEVKENKNSIFFYIKCLEFFIYII